MQHKLVQEALQKKERAAITAQKALAVQRAIVRDTMPKMSAVILRDMTDEDHNADALSDISDTEVDQYMDTYFPDITDPEPYRKMYKVAIHHSNAHKREKARRVRVAKASAVMGVDLAEAQRQQVEQQAKENEHAATRRESGFATFTTWLTTRIAEAAKKATAQAEAVDRARRRFAEAERLLRSAAEGGTARKSPEEFVQGAQDLLGKLGTQLRMADSAVATLAAIKDTMDTRLGKLHTDDAAQVAASRAIFIEHTEAVSGHRATIFAQEIRVQKLLKDYQDRPAPAPAPAPAPTPAPTPTPAPAPASTAVAVPAAPAPASRRRRTPEPPVQFQQQSRSGRIRRPTSRQLPGE